jgi:hypothetical protein
MLHLHYYDYIGFVGTAILVTTYILTQIRLISSFDWQYPLLNLCGAVLIAFSLCFDFNAAAFAIEAFWSVISVYGLIKCRIEYAQLQSLKIARERSCDCPDTLPPEQPSNPHRRNHAA